VRQLGNLDRVVDFRFGSGEYAHHLILELYGLGNIILTNDKYVILALLRLHEYSSTDTTTSNQGGKDVDELTDTLSEQVKVRVGNVYPVTYATTITSAAQTTTAKTVESDTVDSPGDMKDGALTTKSSKQSVLEMNSEEAYEWAKTQLQIYHDKQQKQQQQQQNDDNKKRKKKKKDGGSSSINLKMLLLKPNSGVFHYGPSLIEHCILCANLPPHTKFTLDTLEDVVASLSSWDDLISSLKAEGSRILENFDCGDGKGFILYREKETLGPNTNETNTKATSSALSDAIKKMPHSDKVFEEFQPHLLKQHEDRPRLIYDNFSMAIDEFYSLMEGQKRAIRAEAAEHAARERLEKIRKDQSKRMEGLEIEMVRLKDHARMVETHADDVDKALGVINSALASGMDWEALGELVEVEKANMNPIALLIKKLVLEKDAIVLSLPDTISWDQDSDSSPPIVDVTVSLKEGAYANARIMYERYRASKDKAAKTAEASEMALKAAESNAQRQIEQAQKNKNMTFSVMMQPQRKQHWFEKFHWFITSDNYIVIGGRDAQQNEILVKRYLRPGDAYLHADVHGAPTCILRAKRRRTPKGSTEVLPLSDQALREAGNFAICRSSAWGSRMVTSAWWVESHQVSKTAPTGEYLTVGSFMIRGRKNFLPPTSLEMGLGVLFRLGDDVSVARHANERRDFALMALEQHDDEIKDSEKEPLKGKVSSKTKSRQSTNNNNLGYDGDDNSVLQEGKEQILEGKKMEEDHFTTVNPTEPLTTISKENIDCTDNDDQKEVEKINGEKAPVKKKGLSARDRKLIKKYGSLEAAEDALLKLKQEEKERVAKKKADLEKKDAYRNQSEKQIKQSRGKKTKMKKIAKKYADQDDEDRELAILALQGTQKNKKKKKGGSNIIGAESSSQAKVAAETTALLVRDAGEVVNKLPKDVSEVLAKCLRPKGEIDDEFEVDWSKLDAEVLEQLIGLASKDAQIAAVKRLLQLAETTRIDNYSASLAGIVRTVMKYGYEGIQPIENEEGGGEGKQRKTKAEKAAEKEAWREILAEDGIIDVETDLDGPIDDTAEISKLTGKPLAEDVILYALPVCAPYQVLAQYKYRVKLTPGGTKRGKASKQCVEMFYRSEDQNKGRQANNNKYVEVMKAVNDNEWVQTMCGEVKISAPGASKAIKKQKKNGTKKKK